MPRVKVKDDGSISVIRSREEIIAYYNKQINQRVEALVKAMALGADTTVIQARIGQLNAEKKQKILEGQ